MELALLIYIINILPGIIAASLIVSILGSICWFFWKLFSLDMHTKGPPWYLIVIVVFSMLIALLTPTPKTAYTMAGAYILQHIAETPEAKTVSADVYKIVSNKIKEYAEESDKALSKK